MREDVFIPKVPLNAVSDGTLFETHDLDGLKLKAAFDRTHRLLFVLDSTKDVILPNTVLVIAGNNARKWDDILQNDFGVSPETVRPRHNNKYQKLDIDYGGLEHYADAIRTGNAGGLQEWRLMSSQKQKEFRTEEARKETGLARATVLEAEKTIAELDDFIKLQKDKLKAAKKAIGTEPPKSSAAKILRFEARIEKAQAKRGRSERRLKRAQKRIDSALKSFENYENMPDIGGSTMNENEVKPLFTEDPKIMDAENAFKPVSFAPTFEPEPVIPKPPTFNPEPQTVIPEPQTFTPPPQPTIINPEPSPVSPETPAPTPVTRPIAPISGGNDVPISPAIPTRAGGAYYMLLLLLIGLSIFTLYLYQKKMGGTELPHIASTKQETNIKTPETIPETIIEEPVIIEQVATEPEVMPNVVIEEPVIIEPIVTAPEPIPDVIIEDPVIIEQVGIEPMTTEDTSFFDTNDAANTYPSGFEE